MIVCGLYLLSMSRVHKQKLSPSEHDEQCLIFKWAALQKKKYPCLEFMFATLNGVKLNMGQAIKAKRSGNKSGVPDIILPYPRSPYSGLFIELKVGRNKAQENQIKYINYLNQVGYKAEIAYGSKEAIDQIVDYLEL